MIEPAEPPRARRPGRAGRLAHAVAFGLTDRQAPPVALAGFLLRGGVVLLALPSIIVPSVIGVVSVTGVDAVSIAGQPSLWLLEIVGLAILATAVWLAIAGLAGSLVDLWVIEMAIGGEPGVGRKRRLELPARPAILRLVGIRLMCLVPLAVTLAWAATRIVNATYTELTTPSDLATPLPVRAVLAASDAVAVVTVVWLLTEALAAIAVRREVMAGRGVVSSLVGAGGQMLRRPFSTLLTVVVSYGTSVVAIGLALLATSTAFDWCRVAARNQEPIAVKLGIGDFSTARDFRPVVFALTTLALALAWVVALAVAGVTSAWRSAAFTSEVADALHEEAEPRAALASPLGWDYRARQDRLQGIDPTPALDGPSAGRGMKGFDPESEGPHGGKQSLR